MTALRYLVHVVGPTLSVHTKPNSTDSVRVLSYGDELLITNEVIMANTDTNGKCRLMEWIDDEPRQVRELGQVVVRRGPWPEGKSRLLYGDVEWQEAREAARQEAHKIENGQERTRALARVDQDYGPRPTSRTTATYRR
jgi:hypothetical protein